MNSNNVADYFYIFDILFSIFVGLHFLIYPFWTNVFFCDPLKGRGESEKVNKWNVGSKRVKHVGKLDWNWMGLSLDFSNSILKSCLTEIIINFKTIFQRLLRVKMHFFFHVSCLLNFLICSFYLLIFVFNICSNFVFQSAEYFFLCSILEKSWRNWNILRFVYCV